MTIQEWINKSIGKYVSGDQCANMANNYIVECLGNPIIWGDGKDFWTNYQTNLYEKIPNSPSNFPQLGDIIVWGTQVGAYGHVAVSFTANVNNFQSIDQNWPLGSKCHHQDHNYYGVLGWLRPIKPVVPPVIPPEAPHTPEIPAEEPHTDPIDDTGEIIGEDKPVKKISLLTLILSIIKEILWPKKSNK